MTATSQQPKNDAPPPEAEATSDPQDAERPAPETTAAAPAFTREEALAAEVEQLRGQNAELRDQTLRALAERDNVRKRAQRDIEESGKYALASFARELVQALENLYRASDSLPPDAKTSSDLFKTYAEGLEMTLRDLTATLQRFGIRRIFPKGEPFDHALHQAVAQVDDETHPPGTALQVVQAGYVLHDRLLTPALVVVAKRPSDPAKTGAGANVDTQA